MKILFFVMVLTIMVSSLFAQPVGFSGMEKISDSKFIVVYDKKNFQDGSRVAILKVHDKKAYSIDELKVKDWKHKDGKASDLESVCAIPETKDEFLLVESGYWEGDFGRIFRIELKDEKIKVKKVYQVPSISPAGKNNPEGDNFEGVVCIKNKNKLFILIGERGGTERNPDGLLRIGILKDGKDKIDWKSYAENTFIVKVPKATKDNRPIRSITDLHITNDGVLFASAAVDVGDMGPFNSFVYKVGRLSFKKGKLKITSAKNNKALWIVDGFKIEALSSTPKSISNSTLSIGTEDEAYPGVWRPLYLGN